ncbi:hypothetical protein KHM83_13150 [Fusibacter paucivorans]|uniref:Uncharacterized protein n=1 Tax=Fusibacter paucivorans TaxID=76009 RepID=A0ABS5PSU5_9FIRM|nr:hypothetical protein [Fusibacter paucivorans]MBS7527626.1 hypothetical protein [Fusibacter paucivorans]
MYENFINKMTKEHIDYITSIGIGIKEIFEISKIYSNILIKSKLVNVDGDVKGWFVFGNNKIHEMAIKNTIAR